MDITCQEFDYSTGWSDFMRMSIYGGSPDVSEIGTTWINDFAAMNVLRPFSASEVRSVGGMETFVPAVWQSGVSAGVVWAIPWMTDLSMVCYRRDLLAKAGVQEQEHFRPPNGLNRPCKASSRLASQPRGSYRPSVPISTSITWPCGSGRRARTGGCGKENRTVRPAGGALGHPVVF